MAGGGFYSYTMAYDALNRLMSDKEPFGQVLTFTYDPVGNRTLVQDSQGGTLTSVYDAANRLTSRQFGGVGQTPLRMDLTYTGDEVRRFSVGMEAGPSLENDFEGTHNLLRAETRKTARLL
jgi:YD repeat-containing protein